MSFDPYSRMSSKEIREYGSNMYWAGTFVGALVTLVFIYFVLQLVS